MATETYFVIWATCGLFIGFLFGFLFAALLSSRRLRGASAALECYKTATGVLEDENKALTEELDGNKGHGRPGG